MAEKLSNKYLYKVELYLLKILPMTVALAYLLNAILSYFYIDITIFSHIFGVSLLPLIFMYISSYVFKFCSYHRMFLHYILIIDLLNIYDWYIGINISNRMLLLIHLILSGITLFIILYLYVKSNKKTVITNDR